MKTCQFCSNEMPDDAVFCANCGQKNVVPTVQEAKPIEQVEGTPVVEVVNETQPENPTEEPQKPTFVRPQQNEVKPNQPQIINVPVNQAPAEPAKPSPFGIYLKELLQNTLKILKSPVSTATELAEKASNFKFSLAYIGVQVFVVSFIVLMLTLSLNHNIGKVFDEILGGLGSMFGLDIKVNAFGMFAMSFISIIVVNVFTVLAIFGAGQILKDENLNFTKALTVVGTSCVFTLPFLALACICSFISFASLTFTGFALFLSFLGAVIAGVVGVNMISNLTDIPKDKKAFLTVAVYAVQTIVAAFMMTMTFAIVF